MNISVKFQTNDSQTAPGFGMAGANQATPAFGVAVTDQTGKVIGGSKFQRGSANASGTPEDRVEQRRQSARKQAMKLVKDAWANDQKLDAAAEDRKSYFKEQAQKQAEARAQQQRLQSSMEDMREVYGVAEDSQEQKDLEFLREYKEMNEGLRPRPEGEDEKNAMTKRYFDILQGGLTDYQKDAMHLIEEDIYYKKQERDAGLAMKDAVRDLRTMTIERLKEAPMVKAEKEADAIVEAADKEIIGMLMNDAKDHIDEKHQEEEKKAEEKKEEEKEKEKQEAKRAEEEAIREAMIEGNQEAIRQAKAEARKQTAANMGDFDYSDAQNIQEASGDAAAALEELKSKMALLDVDLMGIEVDERA